MAEFSHGEEDQQKLGFTVSEQMASHTCCLHVLHLKVRGD